MPTTPWTKQQSESNADLNAQEFANTQRILRGNGVPNIPAPLHVEYIDESVSPNQVYRKTGPNSGDWSPVAFDGSGGSAINGAVFITDIEPQGAGTVGSKVYSSGGRVLDSCTADTDLVRVHVLTQMGHTNYEPVITVLGQTVPLVEDEDKSIFTGFVDVDRLGDQSITAQHEDGASSATTITTDVGPEVQTAVFTGGKPGIQTELKENDGVNLQVATDTDMVRIEVADFGAAQADTFDFVASSSETVILRIADRGDTAQQLGVRLRAMNANGSYGAWLETTVAGTSEDLNVVTLNNLHPSVAIDSITYPVGQEALKDSEVANVAQTIADFDTVSYSSPNVELNLQNPNTYEASKEVNRVAGDYNVTTDNFMVTANRTANDASTDGVAIVQIAHTVPEIRISTVDSRLRSGGNQGTVAQNYEVTITSTQLLIARPTISVPEGTLLLAMAGDLNGTSFTQDIQIHDDGVNGSYSFVLDSSTNLAGKVVSVFTDPADYVIGGFVARTISIAAFTNEVSIGTDVSDASRLVARDKDLALLTYSVDFSNVVKTYTVAGPTGVLNATGDLWHWNDVQATNNNTTGGASVTIEETI